jgi:galactose mutarotase-like enzyme
MHTIENDFLNVSFQSKGAELTSIFHKQFKLEYLWQGDPAFWAKQSPILFPIVGALKENTYFYKNRPYQLPRHGFAREKEFVVTKHQESSITFALRHDEETLLVYPFEFDLAITYSLNETTLTVEYKVRNLMNEEMYFSIGGHPAFKVPLDDKTEYQDYFLEFNKEESSECWPVSPDGLIEQIPRRFFEDDSIIQLKKELFLQDALVFKDLRSDSISLKCSKHLNGLDFHFEGFPFMGIWSAKNADFVCIEPWCGIADSVNTDQQLKNKEGMNKLEANSQFNRQWTIRFW